jgi:hypothetical protein
MYFAGIADVGLGNCEYVGVIGLVLEMPCPATYIKGQSAGILRRIDIQEWQRCSA